MTIPRWIVRIWSLFLFSLAILEGILPETDMEWPVLLADWLLPGFYGAAILGLAGRLMFWRLLQGERVNQPFGLSLFGLPALLYLLSRAAAPRTPHWASAERTSQ